MKIFVSDDAEKWFRDEMDIEEGDSIRFFVKYGGSTAVQEGFSLGLMKEEAEDPAVTTTKNGILFFVEEKDVWYFDGHDLHVGYNPTLDEPVFEYKKG
ncbi:HesB/YadR/YfhF family protein [Heyndrickxia camelliae]|uniref:HesB/YadR/YfhF family protein n=1 Tax=Heyndrickxia camelliae TaxID=1707093 RepID=A0A2N3LLS6_9BACI|nr:HesB/YadR/YfhF family protein [Heyndrickxia camelliae]PKR85612.1 HesB/YadR/YfhF family protein [Heyndrickxia camelliae]